MSRSIRTLVGLALLVPCVGSRAQRSRSKLLCCCGFLLLFAQFVGCRKGGAPDRFVHSGGQTYFEVKDSAGLHKVYTNETPELKVLTILDENDVPDVVAMIDSLGARAMVAEFRKDLKVPAGGPALLSKDSINKLPSGDRAFEEWKKQFSKFTVSEGGPNKAFKYKKSAISAMPIKIEGGSITVVSVARMSCENDDPDASPTCNVNPRCRCVVPHVCRAILCALKHDYECMSREMKAALECDALPTNFDDGTEPTPKDLILQEVNGGFQLSF